jgi:choloylglycine hydrolase
MRIALALLLAASPAVACTTFLVDTPSGPAVGKCYDWHMEQGLVFVNARGVDKRAIPMLPSDHPATWRSRFSSLTFNQYGREMPNGGMNEAGLVVEIMWLAATETPAADERPTVNELQWIQYQLDRFATVEEMVQHASDLRVARVNGKVHYLACDRARRCAAFENLAGKMVVSDGTKVLTNDTVAMSKGTLAHYAGFGGKEAIPTGAGSLDRFVRASSLAKSPTGTPVDAAWHVLDSVENSSSRWEIVYDPVHLVAHFRTTGERAEKTADLARLAHDCKTPVKMLDLATAQGGDTTARFTDYDEAANLKLVRESLATIPLPPGTVEKVAHYPVMLQCSN